MKAYLYITSIIFLIVGTIHFLKIVIGFEIQIAGQIYPFWLSLIEMIIAIYLAFVGFKLGKNKD